MSHGTSSPLSGVLHEIAFIATVCAAQFLSLAALNQTVAPVLILAQSFDISDYGTLSWFSAAYSLTVGTFILPAGKLGDIYGHKRVFEIGWAWFSFWSLVCGFCQGKGVVLFSICRAMQGIGPALLVPNAIALIGRTYPVGVKRNMAFATFGAAGPTGATAGAVFGALISQEASWPWCFWILSTLCASAILVSYVIIPKDDSAMGYRRTDRPRFDYLGCLTGVVGLVLVNFALNQAPLVGWAQPSILVPLIVGLLSFGGFIWVELSVSISQALIPVRELRLESVFVLACVFLGWSSHGIWAYYLYLFLEHLRGHSALLTSAETCPVALMGALYAFSTVWLVRHVSVSWIMFLSMVLFVVGSLLMALAPLDQTYWAQTFLSVLIMPGAMNLSFPAATMLMSSALPKEKQGIAASLVTTMVNYSISCGLGLAGSIHRYMNDRVSDRAGFQGAPPPLSLSTPEIVSVRLEALRAAYLFAVGLGGLGVLVSGVFVCVTKRRAKAEECEGESVTVSDESIKGQFPREIMVELGKH